MIDWSFSVPDLQLLLRDSLIDEVKRDYPVRKQDVVEMKPILQEKENWKAKHKAVLKENETLAK